ncbi:MAG: DUF2309 family protein [Polyangiaceae bacterium]|nr:DUF2309 family protein [Polyangiaceae bacterium]
MSEGRDRSVTPDPAAPRPEVQILCCGGAGGESLRHRLGVVDPGIEVLLADAELRGSLERREGALRAAGEGSRIELAWVSAREALSPAKMLIRGAARAPAEVPRGLTSRDAAGLVQDALLARGPSAGRARLVVVLGHGAPWTRRSRHRCGSCGGRLDARTARQLASLACRPDVRALLAAEGAGLPDDAYFVAAARDSDAYVVTWLDLSLVPRYLAPELMRVRQALLTAAHLGRSAGAQLARGR